MTDIPALIARVRELDAAATPGPWDSEYDGNGYHINGGGVFVGDHYEGYREDAALISTYRTAAPALATALDAAMAENERLRTELEMIRDAAADAIRDNEHVGFTVRTLHVLRSIKLKGTR